jgi:hypothetical protein
MRVPGVQFFHDAQAFSFAAAENLPALHGVQTLSNLLFPRVVTLVPAEHVLHFKQVSWFL